MLANEHIPEGHDARLEGVASEAQRREAGGPQPLRDGNEAGLGRRKKLETIKHLERSARAEVTLRQKALDHQLAAEKQKPR
jgi:hypothetical protein